MLAYRSRATTHPSQIDLDGILRAAQKRNQRENLTGLLIYDQGCFFQWLEGPEASLMRVWESIQRDPRHHSIDILREQAIPKRFFGAWDMRLARRARGKIDAALAVIEAPRELLQRLPARPVAISGDAWDRLFCDVVIPGLKAAHPLRSSAEAPAVGAPGIWHARREAAAELAHMLTAVDGGGTASFVDDLVGQGASLEALYREVFEPAARCLGGLWEEDGGGGFNVTLGLGRLQVEVRRLSAGAERGGVAKLGAAHSVLVAPQPGELHGLGAAMASEMFWREGWDVNCEFPTNDGLLNDMLHDRWYDVLDLSLSVAQRRDRQLPAMRLTIRAAQAASLNPALAVIVDGRSFVENSRARVDVGADASCITSIDVVASAQRLLDVIAARNNPVARLATAPAATASALAEAASMNLFERRFLSTVF